MKKKLKNVPLCTKLFWLLAAGVFLIMLVFNILTPMLSDDYAFAFSFADKSRLTGFADAFRSQQAHYFNWSGRFIIKLLAQWFTVPPKILFNLFNAAVFTGLGLLIYRLAHARRSPYSPLLLLFVFLGLWQFSPAFGQTNLWMCGACNYLWATFFCFAALLPFGLYLKKPFDAPRWLCFAAFFMGVVAGWSSENTSAGLLVALVLCIGFELIYSRRAPLWMWMGFAGALAGFALLVLAPGNYMRHDSAPDPRSPFTILTVRFLSALDMLWQHGLVLLLVFAVLYCLLVLQKPGARALVWPLIPIFAGLGANFAMLLSPVYYERSTHGVLSFLLLGCIACAAQLKMPAVKPAALCCAAVLTVITAFQLVWAGYDILSYSMMYKNREASILQAKAAGETHIETYAIEPYTRWCAAYGLPDFRADAADWLSVEAARYYGVASITAQETRTYPFPGQTNSAFESGQTVT